MSKVRLAIMISGRGSNMDALLSACDQEDYPAQPVLILSNRPDAPGLRAARAKGLKAAAVDHKIYGEDREAFERELDIALRTAGTQLIALAGFMRVLTPWFVNRWAGRLINIHPSLLPKYPGLHTHRRAIEAGDSHGGASVHWVTEGVDEGAVIEQEAVEIASGETPETLAAKVLEIEHRLYPRALAKACEQIR